MLVAVRMVTARADGTGTGNSTGNGSGTGSASLWADRRYGLRPGLRAPLVRGPGRDAWRASGWPV